jgi:glucokinase
VRFVLGIDIGGTNLVVGSVAEDGSRIVATASEPTHAEAGAKDVLERLVNLAERAIAATTKEVPGAEILGVGVGAPGPLDTKRGIVLLTPNLGWVNLPLRQIIHDRLGLPAALDNDANCAVLGEWWVGAARGARHAIGITIGTGIGGGLILDGKLYHGASDVAGEIGHTTIDTEGRRCKCGNYGCLEAYASGPNIAVRAVEEIEAGAVSRLPSLVNGDLSKVTAQTVYQAAQDGDDLALEVVNDTARFLGVGIGNLLNVFNPEVVVVCGGVTAAGDHLFVPLRRETARRAFKPAVAACRIVPGELAGTAGVYGAAKAFLDQTLGAYGRRHRVAGVGPHPRSRPAGAADRGMGRRRVRAGRAGREPSARLGDRAAHQGRARPRSAGGRAAQGTRAAGAGGPLCGGAGPQQPGGAPLPVGGAPLRADERRGPPLDLARAGPHGDGPRRHLPQLHFRFRAHAGYGPGAATGFSRPDLRRPA